MRTNYFILISLTLLCLLCLAPNLGLANVWIDENFDGAGPSIPPIWVQGDGGGSAVIPADATLDVFVAGGALGGITITGSPLSQTGTKVTSKYFDGPACYEIETGELISVGGNVCNPRNGAFIVLQFGVNVDPIPAAGNVGEFRFNWDTDDTLPSTEYSFYVKLVSDRSKVDINAGEDVKNPLSSPVKIGELASATEWKFITMVMENNVPSATYVHANLPGGTLTQNEGVAFYCSSETQGHFVAMTGNTGNKKVTGLTLSASGGTIYIDTLYWEGGMDNDPAWGVDKTQINIRKFNYAGAATAVNDWNLY